MKKALLVMALPLFAALPTEEKALPQAEDFQDQREIIFEAMDGFARQTTSSEMILT